MTALSRVVTSVCCQRQRLQPRAREPTIAGPPRSIRQALYVDTDLDVVPAAPEHHALEGRVVESVARTGYAFDPERAAICVEALCGLELSQEIRRTGHLLYQRGHDAPAI